MRKSNSLVMVFLSENRFAEKPRAPLGSTSSKGHRLQHCMEIDSPVRQTGESGQPRSVRVSTQLVLCYPCLGKAVGSEQERGRQHVPE